MKYHTRDVENGTEIVVEAEEAAVVVREKGEERIYLPLEDTDTSTYYVDEPSKLVATEKGYKVLHPGEADEVKVFSK